MTELTALHESPLFRTALVLAALLLVMLLALYRKRTSERALREALRQAKEQRNQEVEAILQRVKEAFGSLSMDVLAKNSEAFLQLARESLGQHTQAASSELEGKRQLIDRSIEAMRSEMKKVEEMVTAFERDREKKYGELAEQLRSAAEGTNRLQETAQQLREALSSSRARGQWGERMAEDILRLSGFQEGINYQRQKTMEGSGRRPDFTFLLPQGLQIHMDVKFPFENYLRYLEAHEIGEKDRRKSRFLKDVRARVREITTREYINPEENTLGYALLFIPNEALHAFILEEDATLLDEALRSRVILCSPLTLYAILSVIRQAVETFNLERTTSEVLAHMADFQRQWEAFVRSMEKLGRRLEDARQEFDHLVSTRRNQMERPLREIDRMRREQGILPKTEPPVDENGEATGGAARGLPHEEAPAGDNRLDSLKKQAVKEGSDPR
jgi:DNA recombination protein RmuC